MELRCGAERKGPPQWPPRTDISPVNPDAKAEEVEDASAAEAERKTPQDAERRFRP